MPRPKSQSIKMLIKIHPTCRRKLEAIAVQEGITMSAVIDYAILKLKYREEGDLTGGCNTRL